MSSIRGQIALSVLSDIAKAGKKWVFRLPEINEREVDPAVKAGRASRKYEKKIAMRASRLAKERAHELLSKRRKEAKKVDKREAKRREGEKRWKRMMTIS